MDVYTILAAVVAAITIFSAYWLFNGLPRFGAGSDARRQSRRP